MTDERLPEQIIIWVPVEKVEMEDQRSGHEGVAIEMGSRQLQAEQWRLGMRRQRQSLQTAGSLIFRFTGCDVRF
jgi:hypothetical protein